jgi:ubiquinone/menaquinone biosynthesis C-methylase UbiE
MKELVKMYNESTTWCKALFFISVIFCVVFTYKLFKPQEIISESKEGFETNNNFEVKMNDNIYDDFYSSVYDSLVFNEIKSEFEVGQIITTTTPTNESLILDVGCGTGNTIHRFVEKGYSNIIGIDKSKNMIDKAISKYPDNKFEIADIMNMSEFPYDESTFTHILCLYFTIYYMKNKETFFKNCYSLLKHGGFLVVHLVDRNRFDPILPPGNPFYIVSPQSYSKERITQTNVDFNGFNYNAKFDLNKETNTATFEEKFKKKKTNQVRINKHTLYMETVTEIIQKAHDVGFITHAKIDMMRCAYDYQYMYVFYKPY